MWQRSRIHAIYRQAKSGMGLPAMWNDNTGEKMSWFEMKKEEEEKEVRQELPPLKSDITEEMVKEQLQKELDRYAMNMPIIQVTLIKSESSYGWNPSLTKHRDFEEQTWSVDIENERFQVRNEFDKEKGKIIFDAEKRAKNIILQTGKKLSKKARSMFGGATVINGGEGNIFLKLGYCNRCKKKVPLISRHGVVARNYWDVVPKVCPYCLFKENGYDIKIHKIIREKKDGKNGIHLQ